ncbi:hypothetical protein HK097_008252 [Rhizophlyctis rosea]|uniref:UAS domain-containing protein n=1 Tax=Rhizophlyctis rosea TaxID=64517 RepID=A0AAD5SD81_9FUNG|nr:hypothetical protein HK097_008252 [Rhizophlyctis rosea]
MPSSYYQKRIYEDTGRNSALTPGPKDPYEWSPPIPSNDETRIQWNGNKLLPADQMDIRQMPGRLCPTFYFEGRCSVNEGRCKKEHLAGFDRALFSPYVYMQPRLEEKLNRPKLMKFFKKNPDIVACICDGESRSAAMKFATKKEAWNWLKQPIFYSGFPIKMVPVEDENLVRDLNELDMQLHPDAPPRGYPTEAKPYVRYEGIPTAANRWIQRAGPFVQALRQRKQNANNAGKDGLKALYQPPVDIAFRGDFDEARGVARMQKKGLLITIYDMNEFGCHEMDRDLFNREEVKTFIRENFIFVMWQPDSYYGREHMESYPYEGSPYLAIFDPATGERVKQWNTVPSMADFLMEGKPSKTWKAYTKKKQLERDSLVAQKIAHTSEEQQMEEDELMAMRMQLAEEGVPTQELWQHDLDLSDEALLSDSSAPARAKKKAAHEQRKSLTKRKKGGETAAKRAAMAKAVKAAKSQTKNTASVKGEKTVQMKGKGTASEGKGKANATKGKTPAAQGKKTVKTTGKKSRGKSYASRRGWATSDDTDSDEVGRSAKDVLSWSEEVRRSTRAKRGVDRYVPPPMISRPRSSRNAQVPLPAERMTRDYSPHWEGKRWDRDKFMDDELEDEVPLIRNSSRKSAEVDVSHVSHRESGNRPSEVPMEEATTAPPMPPKRVHSPANRSQVGAAAATDTMQDAGGDVDGASSSVGTKNKKRRVVKWALMCWFCRRVFEDGELKCEECKRDRLCDDY